MYFIIYLLKRNNHLANKKIGLTHTAWVDANVDWCRDSLEELNQIIKETSDFNG